jgi:hypothetical protein
MIEALTRRSCQSSPLIRTKAAAMSSNGFNAAEAHREPVLPFSGVMLEQLGSVPFRKVARLQTLGQIGRPPRLCLGCSR